MRIAITGATGLLGRNLLFEIIKQNLNKLDKLKIFILGRDKYNISLRDRIKEIILSDGLYYLDIDSEQTQKIKDYCKESIVYINCDLKEDKLSIGLEDVRILKMEPIDFFFHIGASTDLRDTPEAVKTLKKTNIDGTKRILELIEVLNVKEFCYTGTAYACGAADGVIKADFINRTKKFRSPYEQTKLEGENLVRKFEKKYGIKCRYFRPSTICGRLIQSPLGATPKFDVFYGWGAFFFQMKLKQLKDWDGRYDEPVTLDVRICYNKQSGLNIVPADYIAKVIYQVCSQNAPESSYHLVNNQECSHSLYLLYMLNAFNIQGVRHIGNIPEKMNRLERLYYKTAGKVFTPYINARPMLFDVENLQDVLSKAKLRCPKIDDNTLSILISYAKKYDFGIKKADRIVTNI